MSGAKHHPNITCEPWSSTAEVVISKTVLHLLGPERHDMSIRKSNALHMNVTATISCTSVRYVIASSFLKSNEPSIPRLMRRNGFQGRIIKLAQKRKTVDKISATGTICTCCWVSTGILSTVLTHVFRDISESTRLPESNFNQYFDRLHSEIFNINGTIDKIKYNEAK
jgi:hypothetical protein